jgi:hypothetical protein
MLKERSMCTGNMYRFTEPTDAKQTWTDWNSTKAHLYIEVRELDAAAYCGTWKTSCGDENHTINESDAWDVYKTGTHPFVQSTWWGFRPHLTFYGKVSVKYTSW